MPELDPFETRLARAVGAFADRANTAVDAAEVARAAAGPEGAATGVRMGRGLSFTWALLLVGLLVGLVVGGLVAGSWRSDLAVVIAPSPTGIHVLPPGPTTYSRVVAVSRDELWVLSGGFVWHFDDGSWTATYRVGKDAWALVEELTLAPDGTTWAAGPGGVAYFRDDGWVVADTHAASAVTVDREGTVWVAGTESPCDIWSLRPNGSSWTHTSAGCPFSFGSGGYVHSMAVDGRGALWVGAAGYVVNALARFADGRWEATEARAGLPNDGTVNVLGVSATGDVWIDFQDTSTWTHARARFDGATWTVISGAADLAVAVAPDGAMWASALGRYDWQALEESDPSVVPPLTPLVVAPDGTVFAVDGDGRFVRLPAPTPSVAPSAPSDSMTHGRFLHTATLLEDGRVLITGGAIEAGSDVPSSAELFDPASGTFAPTGSLASKHRAGHTAIRLADGRVLLVGGMPHFDMFWREIWDPATGMFTTPGGKGLDGRFDEYVMAAGPLPDGRILVQRDQSPMAELYDPSSGAVSEVGPLESDPRGATATLLQDGRVLIVGGATTVFHVYDPRTGEFTAVTGAKSMRRAAHAATLLADGRVLLVGGPGTGPDYGAFAEIYDPTTGTVRPTGSMITPRATPVATLLADGRVLVTGGGTGWWGQGGEALASAELYDPATGTFSPTGSMRVARTGHTATLLRDGTVLIAGGRTPDLGRTATAELYDPATGTFSPVGGR